MSRARRCRFGVLAVLALLSLATAARAQTLIKYWVDSRLGRDIYPGTYAQPFRTLNHALQVVYDQLPASGTDFEIGVKLNSVIAPANFGGVEGAGWRTDQEVTDSCQRSSFPIRMLDGVDIVGETGTGSRPVLTIAESTGHTYSAWTDTLSQGSNCSTPLDRAMVMAASDCTFKEFAVDGSRLLSSDPADTGGLIPGVLIGAVQDFLLSDCEVWDWHEQVVLEPGSSSADLSAAIDDCDVHHAWPLDDNQGHAAIRFDGPGDAVVTMDGTTVRNSHDAVEPENGGGTGSFTLTCTGCTFRDNENVFELGGPYVTDIHITDCDFIDNFPHGSSVVTESNTIGLRASTALTTVTVRDSHFSNFSRCMSWWTSDSNSILDLGTDSDLGNNTFCLDYTADASQIALYRACIVQKSPVANITAAGNWWLPNNQDAVGRELSIGPQYGPDNNYPPPGTTSAADCFDESTQQQFKRNYSIQSSGGSIDFGTASLSGTDPAPCTDCTQQ